MAAASVDGLSFVDMCCMRQCHVEMEPARIECNTINQFMSNPCEVTEFRDESDQPGFSCGGPRPCNPPHSDPKPCCQFKCHLEKENAHHECMLRRSCEVNHCILENGDVGYGCGQAKYCDHSLHGTFDSGDVATAVTAADTVPKPISEVASLKKRPDLESDNDTDTDTDIDTNSKSDSDTGTGVKEVDQSPLRRVGNLSSSSGSSSVDNGDGTNGHNLSATVTPTPVQK